MTTFTASKANIGKQAVSVGWADGAKKGVSCIPQVDASALPPMAPVTTGPLIGDVYRMLKLPKGAVVTGGRLLGSRMASGTSAGSTCLGFNIGFDGAFKTQDGTQYGATTASNALGAILVDYAAVVGVKSESGLDMALGGLLYTEGPLEITADEVTVILTTTSSAGSFVSGAALTLDLDYYMGKTA